MSAGLVWQGLEQFKEELRNLPTELSTKGRVRIKAAAEAAKAAIYQGYPKRTGRLRDGLRLRASLGPLSTQIALVNVAPHAGLFDKGTQARHTSIGANHGSMPAGNVFRPHVIRERRAMYADLRAMLIAHGLKVSGDV